MVSATVLESSIDLDAREATESGLSRSQVIDRILAINPGDSREFLARFTGQALAEYLEHLTLTQEPRGRTSRWIRRSGRAAISGRASRP